MHGVEEQLAMDRCSKFKREHEHNGPIRPVLVEGELVIVPDEHSALLQSRESVHTITVALGVDPDRRNTVVSNELWLVSEGEMGTSSSRDPDDFEHEGRESVIGTEMWPVSEQEMHPIWPRGYSVAQWEIQEGIQEEASHTRPSTVQEDVETEYAEWV
jgi:hypothetical protein